MSFTKIDNNNIAPTGVTAGSYTNANITVNESGQITSASNGVAGTGGGGGGGTGLQHTTYTYTPDGSTTTFAATSGITVHTVLVILDGVTQMPTTDYTVSGSNVVFTSAPPANSVLQIRVLGDVASSGGPKISNIAIVDSNWDAIDDTAVDITGGYIKITGTGFVSGCLAYFNQTAAASISFVSSTELRISTGALAASTYVLYVINPDGGVAISVPGVTFSATPAWQTASSLSEQYDNVAITLSLVAQDATSYTLVSGSLPPGLSLNTSTGAITGTVVGVTVDTTYTFTVRATDAQLQDSPRTFTVSIIVSDPYFNRTTLLLSGSATSTNTVIRDSSTNNFNLTAFGDARASNFSPYGTGWSNYFDGNGDYLSLANNAAFDMGSDDFTIDCWFYLTSDASPDNDGLRYATIFSSGPSTAVNSTDYSISVVGNTTTTGTGIGFGGRNSGTLYSLTYTATITKNIWHYVCVVRSGSTLTLYYDGTQVAQNTSFTSNVNTGGNQIRIGALAWFPGGSNYAYYFPGYISALKVVKGVANTPSGVPSTTPTQSTGTSLLTCQSNRFIDASANNFAITGNGDAKVVSFNPFGITNTGVNGSAYFDGSGDYITAPSNTAFALGTGAFTIEAWIFPTSTTSYRTIFTSRGTAANAVFFGLDNGTLFPVLFTSAAVVTSSVAVSLNAWNHVALVRNSGTSTIYVNGVSGGSASNTTDYTATNCLIGIENTSGQYPWFGYISDLRIVKGTAVYTANFTPPTSPLTAVANTQLLTLQYDQPHNNHTFLDSSSNQFLITRSGNATQGTFSPFSPGGWSGYFNGSTDGIVIASGSDNYDFNSWMLESTASKTGTIEAWIYLQSYSTPTAGTGVYTHRCIFGRGSTFLNFGVRPDGKLRFYYYNTSSNQNWYESTANAIQLNTWYHVAFVADAGIGKLYINGVYSSGNRINGGTDSGTTAFNGVAVGTFSEGGIHYIGRENAETTTSRWHGYIANFRIVNGQSLYTTNFTPSTSPLTTTSQGVIGTNCKLLTLHTNRFKDDGPNNRIFTLEGTTRIQAFSPFAPTAVYNPTTHGGSAYFDGSDWLQITDSANQLEFGPGVGAGYLEIWYYPTQAGTQVVLGKGGGTGDWSSTGFLYQLQFTSSAWSWYWKTAANNLTGISSGTYNNNQWFHIVVSSDGTTFALFVNGTRIGTNSTAAVLPTSRSQWRLGQDVSSNWAYGYCAGLKIMRNTVPTEYLVSATSYTVPTAPFTATTNTQLLLNFTDSAILDSTGRTVLETVGDAKSSSVQVKYGTGSLWPSIWSTSNYVRSNGMPQLFNFGGGSWTVEFWIRFTALPALGAPDTWYNLVSQGQGGGINGSSWWCGLYASSSTRYLEIWTSTSGTGWLNSTYSLRSSAFSVAVDTWYHLAYVRDNNTLRIFTNGTELGSAAYSSTLFASSRALEIGSDPANATNWSGYINDLRITRGYARYTANFTAPTVPHRLK